MAVSKRERLNIQTVVQEDVHWVSITFTKKQKKKKLDVELLLKHGAGLNCH